MGITQAAEALSVSHPAVSKLANKMINEGYLVKHPHPTDKRASNLSLTTQSLEIIKQAEPTWKVLKQQLDYKSRGMQVAYVEINEAYSTQTCSSGGGLPDSRPKGIAGLGIREWTCADCGAQHDRDINAAKNILAAGHCRLAVGIPVL